jgi:hypothetical protein
MDEFDRDLRSRIFDYLGGALTLQDLVGWFVGESWDSRTVLASDLDLLLAERDVISEVEFHERLRLTASTVAIDAAAPAPFRMATGDETLVVASQDLGPRTIRQTLVFAGT